VWSQKIPIPTAKRSLEILQERGVSKGKIFIGKHEPKLEFPEGWGSNLQHILRLDQKFFQSPKFPIHVSFTTARIDGG